MNKAIDKDEYERSSFEEIMQPRTVERYSNGTYIDPFVAGAWYGWTKRSDWASAKAQSLLAEIEQDLDEEMKDIERQFPAPNDREELARALEASDWSGVPIGNKALIKLACDLLCSPLQTESAQLPQGWKPVPLRDTDAMMTAAFAAAEESGNRVSSSVIRVIYRAMVDAAPTAKKGS